MTVWGMIGALTCGFAGFGFSAGVAIWRLERAVWELQSAVSMLEREARVNGLGEKG